MERMFTRSDGFPELLITIRRALATGSASYANLLTIGPDRLEDVANILGGVIDVVEGILNDYEATRPQVLLSEEGKIAQARHPMDYRNP